MQFYASVNKLAKPLVTQLIENADALRLNVEQLENGCTIIDAGIKVPGGLEAGRIISEICLGGIGSVTLSQSGQISQWPLTVNVHTGNPVLACLGSQYAGWSLSYEKFYALGSGPARALCVKEDLFNELDYRDDLDTTVLVIEGDKVPPLPLIEKIADACHLAASQLTIILTPTSSLAG
ncbi:MAG: methenyltetrahydromethanopterin cyclohydrolase, partial [Methylococcales bacterium]|nr:methenyltetrahydromethanopterin cyclohydrolase [Methylococcales bacterium]